MVQVLDRLASAGYDSLQLTHTEEHAIYKFEIIDLRQHRATPGPSSVCPAAAAEAAFLSGWRATRQCACDPHQADRCLNCAGARGAREVPINKP